MRRRLIALLLPVAALAPLAGAAADAPKVSSLFPAGASRGETITVEAQGTFKPWPVEARVDPPGVCFEPAEESGTFTVSVAEDAAPGIYRVRLYNGEGATSALPFVVGTVPEVVESEPNDANDQAQAIGLGATVVNGRLQKSGDVDAFAVELEPGQTLVAALEANRRLGSPMDGILQVVSPEGFVVDHADDAPLLDPALSFTAPSAGAYVVRVFAFPAQPDSSIRFSGSDDYVYRLTLTTGGAIEFSHPSAVPVGEAAPEVDPIGRAIPDGSGPLRISPPFEGRRFAWRDDLAGVAEVEVVDLPVEVEVDAEGEPIAAPVLICGRIDASGCVDKFSIRAEPGRSLLLRVEGRSIGSPIDPVLRVADASGSQLAEADDARRDPDPRVSAKVPDDGLLSVAIRDLHGRGGERFVYRIEATYEEPDFAATVDRDHVELKPGTPLEIAVEVDRRNGFDRPITFEAEGLPEGVSLEAAPSEPEGDSSKKVTLRLIGEEADPWSGSIRLIGRGGEDEAVRSVRADRIGGGSTDSLWLTVLPAE